MSHPNIVLILADDMGYGDVACLNPDSRILTPRMDRIAQEGMVFTDAHAASSVCTPSRYSLLTGRYAWRGRLQRGVLGPLEEPLIEQDRLTLPRLLKDRGYATACIGKWHLGMRWPFRSPRQTAGLDWNGEEIVQAALDIDYTRTIQDGPFACGFDQYFGVDVPNFPPYCFIEGDKTVGRPRELKPKTMFGTPGPMVNGWDLAAILPTITDRAVRYIADRSAERAPFFLYVPLTAPHTPIVPTAEFLGQSRAGVYGDWVSQVDHTVGRIVDALTAAELVDDTLLIVTSDNGSPGRDGHWAQPGTVLSTHGHSPSWVLRGMKADTWDGGHRVPLIVRWPVQVPSGRRCDELVCLMDVMATCAGLTGARLPEGVGEDSLDISPYLRGETAASPIRENLVHHGVRGLYGVRHGDWKLIMGTGSGGFSPDPSPGRYDPPEQLYNMKQDVRERRNLYWDHKTIVGELTSLLNMVRQRSTESGQEPVGLRPASAQSE